MDGYEDLSREKKEMLLYAMKNRSPYWTLLGMELLDVKKGWAKVRLPFKRELVHPLGIAHGGAIFSPADSAVAMALIGIVGEDEIFTTVEMKINYLKPFDRGEITAEARILHKGSTIALGEAEVRNGDGALVAKAMATYMIMKSRGAGII